MDVKLYVYDLTRGTARTMSRSLVGIQIDAVYHTSLVFGNIEYFFGAGVQTCRPGHTHHGQPMEVVPMGSTHLPMDTILEYLESLKEIYTPESYDLFAHNCNNFTNDFAMFLVGRGIPSHITNLPKRVLETPFGQMLRPQLDAGMRAATQAPVPAPSTLTTNGRAIASQQSRHATSTVNRNGAASTERAAYGQVVNVSSLNELQRHLKAASTTAATIFFTSSTCAPCKVAYPKYDQLAEQYPQALFIKVDINQDRSVATHYQIRATPTFIAFSKGARQDTWSGADPTLLKSNIEKLVQQTFPPHPHSQLRVPTLQHGSLKPITYTKIPPLDKLMLKLDTASSDKHLRALRTFVEKRQVDPREATLPDLGSIGSTFQTTVLSLPVDVRFAAVDLLRCAMVDTRAGSFFAEEKQALTISSLIKHVNDVENCPLNLRLVTVHLICNLFISPLFVKELMRTGNNLVPPLIQLISTSLLNNPHATTRVAASSLALNLAGTQYRARREEKREAMNQSDQVELAASLIESLSTEENVDAIKPLLLAFGYLVYFAPQEEELMDLVKALDARDIVQACKAHDTLAKEVACLL